ncbi:MAG: serine/threonine-protein kinase [Myxococcaceae bacterium]
MSIAHLSVVQDPSPPIEIGQALGPYVVERMLGEGSMGRVYLGRHQRLGRQVALKVLHDQLLLDQRLVQRFLQEGRVVNQINHQHIVEVHDFVEEMAPDRVYCVMELLKGETLAQRMAAKPTSIESTLEILRQVASALGAAHAVGVVHRDVKPDNIFLVEREGTKDWVKVLDFGVAKMRTEGVSIVESQQGALLGTPRYMAPEQVAGLDVDARTDVYALGTILYEMLSGKAPFEATAFGQLAADIITRAPPPLPKTNALGEKIPAGVASFVMSCLAKQPGDRPQTMGAVEAGLRSDLAAPSSRSTIALVALAVIGVVALLAAVFGGTTPKPPATPEPVRPSLSALPPPPPPAPSVSKDVTVSLVSQPPGATVTRVDTGTVLGQTPLSKDFSRAGTMKLHLELAGYVPVDREVVLDENQRLEVVLVKVAKPVVAKPANPTRPVTDGVIDPY